jgi:hypothetical protein
MLATTAAGAATAGATTAGAATAGAATAGAAGAASGSTGSDDGSGEDGSGEPTVDALQGAPRGGAVKQRVIKTADLTIVTSDPRDGFDKAVRMARSMGGYTLDSRRSEKRLQITLRLPAARFEEALRRLSKLGKVAKRSIGGRDVTTEYVDLTMRLANAQRVRLRYIELLKRATSVEEALKVQKELERITAQIESLKARVGVIENRVTLSTVTLTLETPTTPGPVGWVFYGLYKGVVWLFVWN